LILGAGLGFPPDNEFARFSENPDAKVRAGKLDEGLDILTGLWSGKPFQYDGQHYRLEKTVCWPPPVQQPRIPIWVAELDLNPGDSLVAVPGEGVDQPGRGIDLEEFT
jgi:alkanesulfonate monooxygenase SsuD/methylene tetrahydromethanopterin reductase-like flavin-dependent oxidoreductase (luciferase family)